MTLVSVVAVSTAEARADEGGKLTQLSLAPGDLAIEATAGGVGAYLGLRLFVAELDESGANFGALLTVPLEYGLTVFCSSGGTTLAALALGRDNIGEGFKGALISTAIATPVAAFVSIKLDDWGLENPWVNAAISSTLVGLASGIGFELGSR